MGTIKSEAKMILRIDAEFDLDEMPYDNFMQELNRLGLISVWTETEITEEPAQKMFFKKKKSKK
jgi:hypothetical protein